MIGLALLSAVIIGLTLGLLGGGGSILTVPVLVYALGIPAKTAIAMSLPVVGITSAISAAVHWRLGNVRVTTAMSFGVLAMIGAFGGAKLAVFLTGTLQLLLLGLVMLGAAASMLRSFKGDANDTAPSPTRPVVLTVVALSVGVLTGVVGIGGGFLVVPALVLLAGVPMRQAVGTSLVVIAMNSASGFAGYVGTVAIDWPFLAEFTAAAVAGALVGTALASRVPQATLKRVFAVFLLAMGGFVLFKNRRAFRPTTSAASAPTVSLRSIVAPTP